MRKFPFIFLTALAALVGASASSFGGGFLLLVKPASTFSLTYQSAASSTNTTSTTIDYGTLSYGSGNTSVVVAIEWIDNSSTPTITGVTVGGVALSHVAGSTSSPGGAADVTLDVWQSTSALAGTSGDVQVTYAVAPSWYSAVALYNLQTTTPTPSAVAVNATASGTSTSASLTIPSGGGALVLANSYSGQTIGFTNAAADVTATTNNFTFGHGIATGSQAVTAAVSSTDRIALSVVAWGP